MPYILATEQVELMTKLNEIHNSVIWVGTFVGVLVVLQFIRIVREF